jgi:hypothetical protein
MKVKPSSVALFVGIGVAAYLIWRNIKKTPSNKQSDSNFMNATGSAYTQTRVSKAATLSQLFSKNKGTCPPSCE